MLLLAIGDTTQRGADVCAGSIRHQFMTLDPGIVDRLARRDQRQLRISVEAASPLGGEVIERLELRMSSHLTLKVGWIEAGHPLYRRYAALHSGPKPLGPIPDRRNCSDAGDRDAPPHCGGRASRPSTMPLIVVSVRLAMGEMNCGPMIRSLIGAPTIGQLGLKS